MSADQVTPTWLTGVLYEKGTLSHGSVTDVAPGAPQSTFASCVWRLGVTYTNDVSANAPTRLFLKVSSPALVPGEFDPQFLLQELTFYQRIAGAMDALPPAMTDPITPACYDIACDPDTGASHILLKDVTETHIACLTPPSRENYEQAVDALAHLHAFWWDHPRLGKDVGKYPTPEERKQEWSQAEKSTGAFMAALDARRELLPAWRAVYESVLPALPGLFKRHATGRNLTLVHGDAHLGNFLFPKNAHSGKAYLIDWQFWHPTIGGTDLAFLLAVESETETRRVLEQPLLQRYYRQLLERGVKNYSWDECWNDYRLSVILVSIFIPVWRWSLFNWEVDKPALERSMAAFEDLQCSEFVPTL